MKNQKDMHKRISEADPDRLASYIDMFDRVLLYNLAAALIPREAIEEIMGRWEQAVKVTINTESKLRTNFLESTPQGRVARKQKQPDGEALRLLFLETLSTAKEIVARNLQNDDDGYQLIDGDFE